MPTNEVPKTSFVEKLKKNKKVIIPIGLAVIIVIAAVVGFFVFSGDKTVTSSNSLSTNTNKNRNSGQVQLDRMIDGKLVTAGWENKFPVAVMVENMVSSRPQAGLDRANIVYEALAEGGITRFLAVYASGEEIKKIGPVRSARTYYLDWAKELNAAYVHVGGSPEALRLIPQYDILDLNQFYNSPNFWRAKERAAPHNLYTSSELLARAVVSKEWGPNGSFEAWNYKNKEQPATTTKTLTLNFSSYSYQVEYKYDPVKNDYSRFQAGAEHVMEDGATIRVKNVIVQFAKTRLADAENRLAIETIGEGEARIYLDGKEILGTWKKTTRESRTRYYDSTGQEIEFNRGTAWVEVLPTDRSVTYQ